MNLKQMISGLLEENVFYHVANPDVPGKVLDIRGARWVSIKFDEPVGFSGNPHRGKQEYWDCSADLLFTSAEEARANHDPERAKAQSVKEWFDSEVP